MTQEERETLLDQIETGDMEKLHAIIADLQGRECAPDVAELIEMATHNIYSLAGIGGDW